MDTNKSKFLHVALSVLLAFVEWLFTTYGDAARLWLIQAIEKRYKVDVTPLVNAAYYSAKEWEQAQVKQGGTGG